MELSLDLETLNTDSGSGAVVAIGAVEFGSPAPGAEPMLGRNFYVKMRLSKRYVIDYDTVCWWMDQSHDAREVFRGDDRVSACIGLQRFATWYGAIGKPNVWGHGAAFDPPMLEATFRMEGLKIPWTYRQARDTRTIFDLTNERVVTPAESIQHNALADATNQALAIMRAQEKVSKWNAAWTSREATHNQLSGPSPLISCDMG